MCFYENSIIKKRCILVFDKAFTHVNEEIIKYLNDNKIIYVIIPAGFTRFLQPLDTSINKPFKLALKNSSLSFQQNHLNEVIQNTFSIKNEDIINMISQIWYNDNGCVLFYLCIFVCAFKQTARGGGVG